MFRIIPTARIATSLMPRRRNLATAAVAGAAILALLATGCSGAPNAAITASAPTTTTVIAPTTVTTADTVTDTVIDTGTATASTTSTERVTKISKRTLTPKPAGTTTVVRTRTKMRTSVKTVTAPPPKPKIAFGDGSYVVGKEVAPGIYQASDPNPPDDLCYWELDSHDGDIIDNGVNNGIVHVGSSAFSLRVAGCGGWTKIG
jgi:hypothetical protein